LLFPVEASHSESTSTATPMMMSSHGSAPILCLHELPSRPTSHTDSNGREITKQQLIWPSSSSPIAVPPTLAGCSVATLRPDQRIDFHQHETMYEFFFVLSGKGVVQKVESSDGNTNQNASVRVQTTTIKEECFIQAMPGEQHSFFVSGEETKDLKMFYCGITVGAKHQSLI
jgi:mannose-6-phosphate isomerase-like protein (cupin superfamily)